MMPMSTAFTPPPSAAAHWIEEVAPSRPVRPGARRWYVARLKPRAEERATAILAASGIHVYLPRLLRIRGRNARLKTEPLFRGYAFVYLDPESEELLIARCSPGVLYLLGRGEPSPIPDSLVETIRLRTEAENGERGEIGFRPGERVRIMIEPLRHVEALFDRALNPSGRARVFIQLLGRLVPLEVNLRQLNGI